MQANGNRHMNPADLRPAAKLVGQFPTCMVNSAPLFRRQVPVPRVAEFIVY
jgi:hypothetical protein